MSRDEFNAQHATMDKKLADSYRQLDDHRHATDKNIADLNLHMNKRFDNVTERMEDLQPTNKLDIKKRFDELAQLINTLCHLSRSCSSRSSSCSNHVGHHERHRQPCPQEHGANHL
jgi:hypothetical protein